MRIKSLSLLCLLGVAACGSDKKDSVTIAPPATLELTVALTSTESLAFLGAQDGDGAWQAVAASVGEQKVTLTGDFFGVAYGCSSGGRTTIHVLQATLSDGTRVEVDCGVSGAQNLVTISGAVSGLAAGQGAQVDAAGRSATVSGAPGSYTLAAPAGMHDAFARRFAVAPAFDAVIRKNDSAFSDGGTLDFDFSAEGHAPDASAITVSGAGSNETTSVLVDLRSSGDSSFSLGSFAPDAVLTLAQTELRADDLHSVVVGADDASAGTSRAERHLLHTGQAFAVALPALPAMPALSIGEAAPYLRPLVTIPAQFADDHFDLSLEQSTASLSWQVSLTNRYIGGTRSYTLPDLSTVPLFDVNWALASGVPTSWRQFSEQATVGVAPLLEPSRPLVPGAVYRSTTLTGSQTL